MGSRFRGWTFTVNNYDEEDLMRILECNCQAMKAGHEVGESGTPHIQGAVYFTHACTLAVAKERISPRAHLEVMRGSWEDQDYCLKDGCILRNDGQGPEQGKRSDIDSMMEDLQNGASDVELIQSHPSTYARTMRMVDRYRSLTDVRFRTWMTEAEWYWGPTGVGKSHRVFADFDPLTMYVHEVHDKGWWDGYTGQPIVIFNEFRGQIAYDEMLTLIDKWPKKVPRRGREPVPFLAKRILITSSAPPEEIYWRQNEKFDSINQLLRRVNVTHIKEREVYCASLASLATPGYSKFKGT